MSVSTCNEWVGCASQREPEVMTQLGDLAETRPLALVSKVQLHPQQGTQIRPAQEAQIIAINSEGQSLTSSFFGFFDLSTHIPADYPLTLFVLLKHGCLDSHVSEDISVPLSSPPLPQGPTQSRNQKGNRQLAQSDTKHVCALQPMQERC